MNIKLAQTGQPNTPASDWYTTHAQSCCFPTRGICGRRLNFINLGTYQPADITCDACAFWVSTGWSCAAIKAMHYLIVPRQQERPSP